MRVIRLSADDHYQSAVSCAVAIGNFDGFHLGHQAVVEAMLVEAKLRGLVPSVLTFEPHPRRFFRVQHTPFRLQTLSCKLAQLRDAGVKQVFIARFDAALATLDAETFVHRMLHQKLAARHVVTGENFAFGKDRSGSTQLLTRVLTSYSATHAVIAPVKEGNAVCSSSAIRAALESGDVVQAASLLGRPYQLAARVQHGDKRGRVLGYPTANLHFSRELLLPKFGVYAVRTNLGDGVANLGIRPMYRSATPLLEVHLFDAVGDIYGKKLDVQLLQYLRPEASFSSEGALKTQMADDCQKARHLLQEAL